MAHAIDGFELVFTHRSSWKAYLSRAGKELGVVPVTWTKGYGRDSATKKLTQQVWYQDRKELELVNISSDPFLVAVATAENYNIMPHKFKHFNCIFEVRPLGEIVDSNSLKCEIIRRVSADD